MLLQNVYSILVHDALKLDYLEMQSKTGTILECGEISNTFFTGMDTYTSEIKSNTEKWFAKHRFTGNVTKYQNRF